MKQYLCIFRPVSLTFNHCFSLCVFLPLHFSLFFFLFCRYLESCNVPITVKRKCQSSSNTTSSNSDEDKQKAAESSLQVAEGRKTCTSNHLTTNHISCRSQIQSKHLIAEQKQLTWAKKYALLLLCSRIQCETSIAHFTCFLHINTNWQFTCCQIYPTQWQIPQQQDNQCYSLHLLLVLILWLIVVVCYLYYQYSQIISVHLYSISVHINLNIRTMKTDVNKLVS